MHLPVLLNTIMSDSQSILSQLESLELEKDMPRLPITYKEGATYCSLIPSKANLVFNRPLGNPNSPDHQKEQNLQSAFTHEQCPSVYEKPQGNPHLKKTCLLVPKLNDEGLPILNYKKNPAETDLTPRYINAVKLRRRHDIKNKELKARLLLPPREKQINLREYLWVMTRRIGLWAQSSEYYYNLASFGEDELSDEHKKYYLKARDDVILPSCGNLRCINPEHLTKVPGTWGNMTYYADPKGEMDWNAFDDLLTRRSKRKLVDDEGFDYRHLFPVGRETHPCKLPKGRLFYCDNYRFTSFSDFSVPIRGVGTLTSKALGMAYLMQNLPQWGNSSMKKLEARILYKQVLEAYVKVTDLDGIGTFREVSF